MKWTNIAGLDRVADVYGAPLRAADVVGPDQWRVIHAGWVAVVWSAVQVVAGVVRLDGVLRVGAGPGREVVPVFFVRGLVVVSGVLRGGVPGVLSVGGLVGVAGVLGVRNV